jgi:GTPase
MVGQKVAIVSDKPQTTRTRIVGVQNYPDGQIVFVDTPGIHRPLHRLNVRMVDAAVETLREVDVVVLVFDASTRPGSGDAFVSRLLEHVTRPVVLALNKIDLVAKAKLLPLIAQVRVGTTSRRLCRCRRRPVTGSIGLETCAAGSAARGRADPRRGLPHRPAGTCHRRRDGSRESARAHARRAAVLDGRAGGPVQRGGPAAAAVLHDLVEQDSQKPIVIGRGGEMIKRIGTEARLDLERFFGTKVFLDLRVKVNPNWRNDDRALDELGVPRTARRPRRQRQ